MLNVNGKHMKPFDFHDESGLGGNVTILRAEVLWRSEDMYTGKYRVREWERLGARERVEREKVGQVRDG